MHFPLAIVILAAGKGTRMKSATPKILHKIGGKTLLDHVLTTACKVDPDHIVLVVGHEHEKIRQAGEKIAKDNNYKIEIALQEKPAGTGDAVACALTKLPDFTGNVVVLSADVPLLNVESVQELVDHQITSPAAVATMLTTTLTDPTGYGRVIRAADGTVAEIIEHKDADQKELEIKEINSGIYVFNANFLRTTLPLLTTNNSQHEFYLTDTISIARKQGKIVLGRYIADSAQVTGCNDRWQLAQLAGIANQRILKKHMLNGVSIIDPRSTWIEEDVTIGIDTTILPGTHISGKTTIGKNNLIGPDTTLESTTVGDNTKIIRSYLINSIISSETTIGPFSYLRPNTTTESNSKIGAFVEVKNSSIGENTKVPHLSYVGDTSIGADSNFGAGTIVANYDGRTKHPTTVGDNVKLGANTVLVAPVNVANNTYTGAGTIVRDDLPENSLAVAESEFKIIKNWVLKNRTKKARPTSPDQ